MKFYIPRNRFGVALIVGTLAFTMAGFAQTKNSSSNMPTGKQFIADQAKINVGEIELGRLAEQKGNNPAVRDFGKLMVENHSMLNSKLRQIAENEGVKLPSELEAEDVVLKQQLEKQSGAQFDDAYIRHMLAGHKGAIDQLDYEIEHGKNPATKSYAETALPVLQDHIRDAEDVAGKMQLAGATGLNSPQRAINAPVGNGPRTGG